MFFFYSLIVLLSLIWLNKHILPACNPYCLQYDAIICLWRTLELVYATNNFSVIATILLSLPTLTTFTKYYRLRWRLRTSKQNINALLLFIFIIKSDTAPFSTPTFTSTMLQRYYYRYMYHVLPLPTQQLHKQVTMQLLQASPSTFNFQSVRLIDTITS